MIKNETQTLFTKYSLLQTILPYFKPTFQISKYTTEQQKFLKMFNFHYSQITKKEFEQLVELLLKYTKVHTTSKIDVRKVISTLHLPLKHDVISKKQRASNVPFHLQGKVNRLLDILEHYEVISPVNKGELPEGNTFINRVIILAKENH